MHASLDNKQEQAQFSLLIKHNFEKCIPTLIAKRFFLLKQGIASSSQ